MAETKINMMEMAKQITLTVKVKRMKEFRLRVWIAMKLIQFAAKIAGVQFEEVSNELP